MNRKFFVLPLVIACLSSISVFAQSDDDRPVIRKDRKSNAVTPVTAIFAVAPMQVTEDNVGFGVSYEHFLDKNGIVSLYLPLSYALPQAGVSDYYVRSNYPYNYPYNNSLRDEFITNKGMVNFYPGIKIYPGGAHKKVTYALGTSLVVGVGSAERRTIDYRVDTTFNGSYPTYSYAIKKDETENVSRFKMGMIITNFLNVRPGEKYYLGVEFGLGYSYMNTVGGEEDIRTALVQLGLKIGLTH